jgi:hypothetical protein
MRSVKNIAINGTAKAGFLLLKYAPPNKAIAPIAVKFGRWGISLVKAAAAIITHKTRNLGEINLEFIK